MRKSLAACAVFIALCALAANGFCEDNFGLSLGYGMAAFNKDRSFGHVQSGKSYNFIQAVFLYEKPLTQKELALVVEPFVAYVNNPTSGADVGFDLGLKYYPFKPQSGLYLTAGPGMAYTSIGFEEQGTHLLFVVQGGIGYRYKNLFIEDRFRHYSNGGTASPNWSVNANIITLGTHF